MSSGRPAGSAAAGPAAAALLAALAAPFGLAATALRSDSSVAFYNDTAGASGDTEATMLLGSYKLTPHLAPLVRLGFVQNDARCSDGGRRLVVRQPARRRDLRAAASARFAGRSSWVARSPSGGAAATTPTPGAATANKAGIAARSGMDNSMFAVNYFTGIVGGDARLRRPQADRFRPRRRCSSSCACTAMTPARPAPTRPAPTRRWDSTRGYFVLPHLSLGAELRYQRWLTTATQISNGAKADIPDANKDTMTVAIGPRAHFAIGKGMYLRPGLSYSRGLDQPLTTSSYNVLQVDLPVVF